MIAQECMSCGKVTGHKRRFGVGTIIALVFTLGWWVLVLPLYPKRCVVCGM
jgi:hypothetical protein